MYGHTAMAMNSDLRLDMSPFSTVLEASSVFDRVVGCETTLEPSRLCWIFLMSIGRYSDRGDNNGRAWDETRGEARGST